MYAEPEMELGVLNRIADITTSPSRNLNEFTQIIKSVHVILPFYCLMFYALDHNGKVEILFDWFSQEKISPTCEDKCKLSLLPLNRNSQIIWTSNQSFCPISSNDLLQDSFSFEFKAQSGIVTSYPSHHAEYRNYVIHLMLEQDKPSQLYLIALKTLLPFFASFFDRKERMHNSHCILTCREKETLSWIAKGKTVWAISRIMGVSERTVKFHAGNIYRKLNVSNRTQAVAVAVDMGIIDVNAH